MWRTDTVLTVGTEMLHITICTVSGHFMSLNVWGRNHVSWSLAHTKVHQVLFQIVRQTAMTPSTARMTSLKRTQLAF